MARPLHQPLILPGSDLLFGYRPGVVRIRRTNQYEPILPALGAKLPSRGDTPAGPLVPKQPRDEGDGRRSLRFGRRSEPHPMHAATANESGAIRVKHLARDERLPIISVR